MKDQMHRHSWWVWVLIAVAGWALLAFAAPKIQDMSPWVRDRPAIYGPR